jgi:hypothetical protein
LLVIILSSALIIFGNSYLLSANYEILSILVISYSLFGLFIIWITNNLDKKNLFFISTLFIFFIPYTASSIYLLIIPEIFETITLRKINIVSTYELKHIALAFIAFSSMYAGYFLSKNFFKFDIIKIGNKSEYKLNIHTFWLLIFISIIAVVTLLKLGMYGFTANKESFSRYISIAEILYILAGFLKLSIIIIFYEYLISHNKKFLILTMILMLINVVIGVLSLYKFSILEPFLALALLLYVMKKPYSISVAILGILIFLTLYLPIDALRADLVKGEIKRQDVFKTIIEEVNKINPKEELNKSSSLTNSQKIGNGDEKIKINPWQKSLMFSVNLSDRLNHAFIGSLAIRDADANLSDTPNFLNEILLAPLYAVIPRVIWAEKPKASYGAWYASKLIKYEDKNNELSITIGPVSGFYYAGGINAVICMFLIVGVLIHKIDIDELNVKSAKNILFYFLLIKTIVFLGDNFSTFIVAIIRGCLFWMLINYLLYKSNFIEIFLRKALSKRTTKYS